jgi:hypothetical protein
MATSEWLVRLSGLQEEIGFEDLAIEADRASKSRIGLALLGCLALLSNT